ncbi:hypothetical protein HMPREF3098_02090 [Corynebacterium sp. HMSC28B08]|nr:hypothetical protein HMPREF3098_02090 [Corynebacterium sp. HMSC28B08]
MGAWVVVGAWVRGCCGCVAAWVLWVRGCAGVVGAWLRGLVMHRVSEKQNEMHTGGELFGKAE